jgi:hypothetical protein
MPQTLKEKRIKAITGYEAAIARHESSLESAEFRLKGYKKSQAAGPKDLLLDRVVDEVSATIVYEKDKIVKLKDHVLHTSQALGYGNRSTT